MLKKNRMPTIVGAPARPVFDRTRTAPTQGLPMPIKKKKLAPPSFAAIVDRRELKHALAVLSVVVPSRSVHPMLEYVVLDFAPGLLTLTGTNLDVVVIATVQGRILDCARALVLLREFTTLIRGGADTIELTVTANVVTVQNGSGKAQLPTGDAAEYPDLTSGMWANLGDATVEVEARGLAQRVGFLRRAIGTDEEKRYAIASMFMTIEKQELVFATTDGRRMHTTSLDLHERTENACQAVLLSPVAAHALSKLIPKKADGRLVVQFPPLAERASKSDLYCGGHGGVVRLALGAFTILDRTVSGEFLSYDRVIPASVKTEVVAESDAIEMALDQVVGVCTSDARAVRLSPDGAAQVVGLRAGSRHGAQAESAFAFELLFGNTFHDFALNPDYLRDAVAGRGQVRLGWNEKNQPVRLDGADDCLAVIMPITLDS